ncbi:DUF2164 domain-containing protein [Hyphococcus sp.]|uniref:DUF2164 domain-containing protein n=1 Tax=Hyphococcus sp. TaxID=2038636 RepID=UPI0035C67B68
MTDIEFSAGEREAIVTEIKAYLRDDLDVEIGGVDAGFLLDFFAEKIGGYFYNRGLYDAQALLSKRIEEIGEAIVDLEKPTSVLR